MKRSFEFKKVNNYQFQKRTGGFIGTQTNLNTKSEHILKDYYGSYFFPGKGFS